MLTRAILEHDMEESTTGDLPSTSKPQKEADDLLGAVLKIADTMEALLFIRSDMELGNTTLYEIEKYLNEKLRKNINTLHGLDETKDKDEIRRVVRSALTVISHKRHPHMKGKLVHV